MNEKYEWVFTTCRDLGEARKKGKLTQEQLEYELAKVTLEMLEEYAPKYTPEKPLDLRRFESLRNEEIARMAKSDYEKMAAHASEAKRQWLLDTTKLTSINKSNFLWLETVKGILEKRNHERVEDVQLVMNQHKEAVYA